MQCYRSYRRISRNRTAQLDGHVLPEHLGHRLELARDNPAYDNFASKFFEHFVTSRKP